MNNRTTYQLHVNGVAVAPERGSAFNAEADLAHTHHTPDDVVTIVVTTTPEAAPETTTTNADRAYWAEEALRTYWRHTMPASPFPLDTFGGRERGDQAEDLGTALGDLLADLMHFADREGIDYGYHAERARDHYSAERAEEDEEARTPSLADRAKAAVNTALAEHYTAAGDRCECWYCKEQRS